MYLPYWGNQKRDKEQENFFTFLISENICQVLQCDRPPDGNTKCANFHISGLGSALVPRVGIIT